MAFGPKDIEMIHEDRERVVALENFIDDQLRRRYSGGAFCLRITRRNQTDIGSNGEIIRNELRKRYLRVGWSKVEFKDGGFNSTGRDGESIILTP